jgi:paraquat-inducible protein A
MRYRRFRQLIWSVRGCIVASAVLLGAGLAGPCMVIHPAFGKLDFWVRLFKPDLARPTSYSVVGGILTLMRNGNMAIGLLLLAFSVFFPALKLAVMAAATAALADGRPVGPLMKLAHHAGKFSMLDVFVVGLIVLAIKGLPGGSRVTLGWGVGAFSASVVLGLVIGFAIQWLERHNAPLPAAPPRPHSTEPPNQARAVGSDPTAA